MIWKVPEGCHYCVFDMNINIDLMPCLTIPRSVVTQDKSLAKRIDENSSKFKRKLPEDKKHVFLVPKSSGKFREWGIANYWIKYGKLPGIRIQEMLGDWKFG